MKIDITSSGDTKFQSGIKHLKDEIPRIVLGSTLGAATLTIEAARPTVPRVSGAASRTLQAFQSGTGAIAQGGGAVDYYRWLELGGASGRQHANKRSVVADGRYILPAYRRIEPKVQARMNEELIAGIKRAGLG